MEDDVGEWVANVAVFAPSAEDVCPGSTPEPTGELVRPGEWCVGESTPCLLSEFEDDDDDDDDTLSKSPPSSPTNLPTHPPSSPT